MWNIIHGCMAVGLWMYGRWLDLDENNEKKYYVFQAKKDGQIWQIAADPKGGQLVQITAAED